MLELDEAEFSMKSGSHIIMNSIGYHRLVCEVQVTCTGEYTTALQKCSQIMDCYAYDIHI